MNATQKTNVLDKVVLFHLDVHLWSGRKKLRPEDVRGQVPPKKLASLGSKRIVDPAATKQFETLKRKAERLLFSNGIRLMGAYAIPLDKADFVVKELAELKAEFDEKFKIFIDNYSFAVENWIKEQEEWAEIIRSSITPVQEIQKRVSFHWQIYHLRPTGNSSLDSGLNDQVGSLGNKLIKEIVSEANKIFDGQFLVKPKVTVKTTGSLKALHKKLASLSFLDTRANAIGNRLQQVLDELPEAGDLEGEMLAKVFGMLIILSDEERFMTIGKQIADGTDLDDETLIDISGKPVQRFPENSAPEIEVAPATSKQLTVDLIDDDESEEEGEDDSDVAEPETSPKSVSMPAVWF